MNYIDGNTLAGKRFKVLENGDLREVKRGKFVPKYDDKYYFITDRGAVTHSIWKDDEIDHWRMKRFILFPTEGECKEYKGYLKALDKYTFTPNWSDFGQEKWELYYDHEEKLIGDSFTNKQQYNTCYFNSRENIEAFIAEVGEDAVKCFMFDVWE